MKGERETAKTLASAQSRLSRFLRLPPSPSRLSRQQPPRRDSAHATDGKPDRRQGHQQAAGEPDRRALPGNVQREKGRADGRQPPGSQPEEHERRVAHPGQRADQASRDRHQQALARQKPRDLPRAKPQGQEQPHVFRALFDPQAEQEHDEHHRRGNHEEAEGQEEHAEGRRAGRGLQGLVLDRPEDESLRHRVEVEPLGKRLGRGFRRIPGRAESAARSFAQNGSPTAAAPWPARRTPWAWRRTWSNSGRRPA